MKAFVYIEHNGEELAPISREALAAAKRDLGADVTALIFGSEAEEMAEQAFQYGADDVIACDDESLDSGLVEAIGPLVVEILQDQEPDVFLAGGSIGGRDAPGSGHRAGPAYVRALPGRGVCAQRHRGAATRDPRVQGRRRCDAVG